MNIIDINFNTLKNNVKTLSVMEIYHIIRNNFDNVQEETKNNIENFLNQFKYWGILDRKNNIYEEIELKAIELHDHIDDFSWLYNNLEDYRSKKTLFSILNNWYKYDFKNTTESRESMFDDYFDLDLIKCNNEIIVDIGAFTGDTVLSYIKNYGVNSYKKIYCYEITKETFDILKKNLSNFPNIIFKNIGISNKKEMMNLENNDYSSANKLKNGIGNIPVTTLDIDINEKITLIKADIEGEEQNMILGAKNHIKNDHPKLLISVYHKNEDLWKIPKMIKEIDDTYKFYLRYTGSPIYPTEITLIAI